MKINIESFLFDNTLMNYCVFSLTAAWLGIRIRLLPTALVSLIGAAYALLSLFMIPLMREWYLKLPSFLLISLPLFRKAGTWIRTVPFLLLSAATVGGSVMLLTLLFGGSIHADGSVIGTVPVRAALVSVALACTLPRLLRAMLQTRRKKSFETTVVVQLGCHTYRLTAIVDSGNLLKEPISGLPVLLIDRAPDAPNLPIPYSGATQSSVLLGERARSVVLPDYHHAAIDCICAQSPHPIGGAEAILPESLLPGDWRTKHDCMAAAHLGAPALTARNWQTHYLLVHSHKRRASAAARSGGRSAMH